MLKAIPLALLLALSSNVAAQEQSNPFRMWLDLGPAGAPATGIGVLGQLASDVGIHHVGIRAAILADFSGFPDSGSTDGWGEFSLLYGRTVTMSRGVFTYATGLSYVGASECDGYGSDSCQTIGIPLIAEGMLQMKYAGLGIQTFANINAKRSVIGIALMYRFGYMPRR